MEVCRERRRRIESSTAYPNLARAKGQKYGAGLSHIYHDLFA